MKIRSKCFLLGCIIISSSALLTGCIPGDGANDISNPAGFFWGVWHGWVAPISLVGSVFNHKLRLYEVNNIGWWYDFGFYIAIISGFGGLSLSREKHRCNKEKK